MTLEINEDNVHRVVKFMRAKAQLYRDNAGYSGAMHDGGAARLEEAIEAFLHGYFRKSWPQKWFKDIEEMSKNDDPEYKEYLRLKDKFKE